MGGSRSTRFWLAVVAVLISLGVGLVSLAQEVSGAHSRGYVVILKNNQRIRASEPMKIVGKQVFINLATGTMTAIPLKMVDIIATERYNKQGFGNALTIEGLDFSGTPAPTPTPDVPLGSIASINARGKAILGSSSTPTPTPTPGIKLQSVPYANERVDKAFKQIFDASHLYLYRTSVGTKPNYYFIQAITDSEKEVFHTLVTVSKAFSLIRKLHPELAPSAVELEMRTTSGKAAGTFRLLPEDAEQLNSGKVSPEQFYVSHVIF
ncbi:MAG: hypothetical protein GXP47_03240 [Acidobacteria bacterium]|nr:hypothetical protein [Acidobacteriota bacterium]